MPVKVERANIPTGDDDDLEALKRQVDEAAEQPEQVGEAASDPRDEEVWTFELDFIDKRGKAWPGTFSNSILTIHEKQKAAVIESRFAQGQPLSSIDSDILALNGIIAHLTLSLRQKPKWAEDLRKLNDIDVLLAIWKKVASHEARFHRSEED